VACCPGCRVYVVVPMASAVHCQISKPPLVRLVVVGLPPSYPTPRDTQWSCCNCTIPSPRLCTCTIRRLCASIPMSNTCTAAQGWTPKKLQRCLYLKIWTWASHPQSRHGHTQHPILSSSLLLSPALSCSLLLSPALSCSLLLSPLRTTPPLTDPTQPLSLLTHLNTP
jgi:hypothetical protein